VLIIGLYGGILPVVLAEAAPASVRCTAVSLGYNITFGVIGGLTPLMAAWLVDRTGDEIAPAFLIMAAAATIGDDRALSRKLSGPVPGRGGEIRRSLCMRPKAGVLAVPRPMWQGTRRLRASIVPVPFRSAGMLR
jgi:hypothetical protein